MKNIGFLYVLHNECFNFEGGEVYKFGCTYDIKRRKYDSVYVTAFVKECYYKTYFRCVLTDESIFMLESCVKQILRDNGYQKDDTIGKEMYHVEYGILVKIIIDVLKKHKINYSQHDDDIEKKPSYITIDNGLPSLYFNQRGAGCGKTYECIQLLKNKKYSHISHFMFLTKMHSAKTVIKEELKKQIQCSEIEGDVNDIEEHYKHWKYSCMNSMNKIVNVSISTIDAFMYKIGDKNYRKVDSLFTNLVLSVINGHECNKKINFAGYNITLEKSTLIVIDETQDLSPLYAKALIELMQQKVIDLYVLGDKLQSIWGENNFYTYIGNVINSPNMEQINIIENNGRNIVRRFHNYNFIDLINKYVKFENYKLPPIEGICDLKSCKIDHKKLQSSKIPCFERLYIKDAFYDKNHNFSEEINKILSKMEKLVVEYDYKPKNFMFIFPILKRNSFVNLLALALENFWIQKEIENDRKTPYVYVHQSDKEGVIDLEISNESTRILSIHTSKGQGREVVFALDLFDNRLKRFSEKENLQYESLLHVALTRHKTHLYLGLSEKKDLLEKRFSGKKEDSSFYLYEQEAFTPKSIISYFGNDPKFGEFMRDSFVEGNDTINKISIVNTNGIIDWNHHVVRYYCMFYACIIKLSDNNDFTNQFYTVLNKIFKTNLPKRKKPTIKEKIKFNVYDNEDYRKSISCEKYEKNGIAYSEPKWKNDKNLRLPILDRKSDLQYNYPKELKLILQRIQQKLHLFPEYDLCPLECTVLFHVYYIYNNGAYSDVQIFHIYEIMNCYEHNHIENHGTDKKIKCYCDKVFKKCTKKNPNSEMHDFYEILAKFNGQLDNLLNTLHSKYNEKFKFNVCINPKLTNRYITIKSKIEFIGYSKNYVIIIQLKPDLNEINIHETLFELGLQSHIVQNQSISEKKTYENYYGKNILNCIVSLTAEPIIFEYNKSEDVKNTLKDFIYKRIYNQYVELGNDLYKHWKQLKEEKKKKKKETILNKLFNKLEDDLEDGVTLKDFKKKYDRNLKRILNEEFDKLYNNE